MRRTFKKCLLASLFVFSYLLNPPSLMGQVTVGSKLKPIEGALLDLKEEANDTGGATSTKGMMLPRVALSTLTPASGKLSESINNTGTWTESSHTGLLVYNVVNTLDACTGGAYDGLYVWAGSTWLPIYQKAIEVPSTITSTDSYDGANSYIVAPNSSVTIPVKRGFDIWTAYAGSTASTGKVLNISDVASLTGTLTTNIIWQDAGTVSSATISGTGSAANLVVTTGASEGNALVQVLIAGKVLWQWHIWVSKADPLQDAQVYRIGGDDYFYMNRLLGASSTSNVGLYYQWGRNVPMQKTGTLTTVAATTAEKDNLTNAIQSEKFIIYNSIVSHDWYSSTAALWNARWTITGAEKTAFDPCPRGWRVPSTATTPNPLGCVGNSANTQDSFMTSVLNGYRSNGDGSLGDVGTAGYVWTADINGIMANTLYYNGTVKNNADAFNRANAFNVRCIKE